MDSQERDLQVSVVPSLDTRVVPTQSPWSRGGVEWGCLRRSSSVLKERYRQSEKPNVEGFLIYTLGMVKIGDNGSNLSLQFFPKVHYLEVPTSL